MITLLSVLDPLGPVLVVVLSNTKPETVMSTCMWVARVSDWIVP